VIFLHFVNGQTTVSTAQTLSVPGIKDKVTIRRDERWIPYIEAQNEDDLYFAQGFAMAQDRLWQMDLLRRVARGETAEIFGSTALERDKYWRRYGFAKICEETVNELRPEIKNALINYAKGVNYYISTLGESEWPPEFQILKYKPREWQPADSLVIGKILADALSSTWQSDLIKAAFAKLPKEKFDKLFPVEAPNDVILFGKDQVSQKSDDEKLVNSAKVNQINIENFIKTANIREESLAMVGLYSEKLAASNNWVVSGKRTFDGQPILANDPHLQASAPSIWYLVHLSTPSLRVAGVTLPGSAGVVLGHNNSIAWGATNVGPDVQDLYLETFDQNDKTKYKTPNGLVQAEVIREEIKVRQNPLDPNSLKTEILEITKTRNGVIIYEDKAGKKYALNWTAFNPKNSELEAFFYLNRARNWEDFKNALKTFGGPMQNFIFADTKGNIGWYAASKIPIRKKGDGSFPYDGATDDGKWVGSIPFEELPNLYNPPSGFIVTANQRIIGKNYKYQQLSRAFVSPHRARRIFELLNANPKLTVEAVRDIQYDTFNAMLSNLARSIVKQSAVSPETLKILGGWDGKMNADSRAALLASEIFNVFRRKVLTAALGQELGTMYGFGNDETFYEWLIKEQPQEWLPKEFASYAELYKSCEEETLKNLGANAMTMTYGSRGAIRFSHPLASAPLVGLRFKIDEIPRFGSGLSPNVGNSVSMRLIATPGNWDKTRHTITLGQDGNPQSPHWKDQLEAWKTGHTPVFPFSKSAIEKATKEMVGLTPKN
jgi:penicillin amidase